MAVENQSQGDGVRAIFDKRDDVDTVLQAFRYHVAIAEPEDITDVDRAFANGNWKTDFLLMTFKREEVEGFIDKLARVNQAFASEFESEVQLVMLRYDLEHFPAA